MRPSILTPMDFTHNDKLRLVARYVLATWTIPIGVAFGFGGLAQNWSRKLRGVPRRSPPEPVGMPEGHGLHKVNDG